MKTIIPLLIIILPFAKGKAQDTSEVRAVNFSAGISYSSTLNYYGRTDSIRMQGIIPTIGLAFRNGIYINGSGIFTIDARNSNYAGLSVEAGYDFKMGNENWTGGIFLAKYFFEKEIRLVQSAINLSAGFKISNLNKVCNLSTGVEIKFGDNTDFVGYAGLDHLFKFSGLQKGNLFFDPSLYVYAGTQNSTREYYVKRNILFIPTGEETEVKQFRKLNVLSYEASAPILYSIGKLTLGVSPTFAIPQNLITQNERETTQNGQQLFYVTVFGRISL